MKKLAVIGAALTLTLALTAAAADAAATKKKPRKPDSRSNYTSEQREKIHLYALDICRKKYGRTALRYATIDYTRHRVMCYIY